VEAAAREEAGLAVAGVPRVVEELAVGVQSGGLER